MTPARGLILAQYRLEEKIGAGGMGEVWKAFDTKLDRPVAIKVLPNEFSTDNQRLARFEREAKVLASLNHANIAVIHGLDRAEGLHFLALERVGGEDLSQRLRRAPIPVDEAIAIARQIAEALEAAHDSGVVHRDLKPASIQITPDGKAKVFDFAPVEHRWTRKLCLWPIHLSACPLKGANPTPCPPRPEPAREPGTGSPPRHVPP